MTTVSGRQRRWLRSIRLERFGYKNYPAYLRSAHWQKLKARYYESDQPQDCICGETEGLQLHHLTYDRVGAEELSDLTSLCGNCHAMIHTLEQRGDIGLDFTGFVDERRAARYRLVERKRTEAIRREREEPRRRLQEYLDSLPLGLRLRNVVYIADRAGIDISSRMRVIERQLLRIERKLANAP